MQNLESCGNKSQGIYVYRSQLPENNQVFNAQDGSLIAIPSEARKAIDMADHQLMSRELIIETEMQTVEAQTELQSKEEDEEEDDDVDEDDINDKEMRDDSFKLFKKFDEATPGHVLRYTFSPDSRPLYYSDYDQFKEPKKTCELCGSMRHFEFQLNAQLLTDVQELRNLDWGIVAVYSCSNSCQVENGKGKNGGSYAREHVEIQLAPEEVDRINHRRMQERKLKQFQQDLEGDDKELTEEEIKQIQTQIKEEDKSGQREAAIQRVKKQTEAKESEMEDKAEKSADKGQSKKLFDQDGDDDWS